MAKVKTIQTRETEEPDERPADPIAINLREFVYEGGPLSDEVKALEYKIRVQQLDRRGRALQGIALETTEIEGLFEHILDELGPGRYLVWLNFKTPGETKFRLLKIKDLDLVDPDAPPSSFGAPSSAPAGLPSGEGRRDIIEVMLSMMNQTTQMMMSAQENNTKLLVAMMEGKRGGDSGTAGVLEAIRLGADLRGGGGGEGGDEDGGTGSLARMGLKLLEILSTKDDAPVDRGALRRVAADEGIDPERFLEEQGLERVPAPAGTNGKK